MLNQTHNGISGKDVNIHQKPFDDDDDSDDDDDDDDDDEELRRKSGQPSMTMNFAMKPANNL